MSKSNSTTDNFFSSQKEKSRVKTLIVTEFFKAYFPIISSTDLNRDVWYIDLFCGPGCYEDGTPSTPVQLLDVIDKFESNDVRNRLKHRETQKEHFGASGFEEVEISTDNHELKSF